VYSEVKSCYCALCCHGRKEPFFTCVVTRRARARKKKETKNLRLVYLDSIVAPILYRVFLSLFGKMQIGKLIGAGCSSSA